MGTKPRSPAPWTVGGSRTKLARTPRCSGGQRQGLQGTARVHRRVGRLVLRGGAAGGEQAQAEGGDQRFARARQGVGQRGDDPLVRVDVLLVLGEIMDEGEVGHAVGGFGPPAQALQVFQRAVVDLGPGGLEGLRALVRAGEAKHWMAVSDQFLDDGRADKTGRASDENAHGMGFSCLGGE